MAANEQKMLFFLFFITLHYTYLENNKEPPGELPSLAQKEVNWGKKERKFDSDLLIFLPGVFVCGSCLAQHIESSRES